MIRSLKTSYPIELGVSRPAVIPGVFVTATSAGITILCSKTLLRKY